MRIVLDTNVLVSALLTPHGPPARVFDRALAGLDVLLWDDRMLAEYRDVLKRRRFGFDPADVDTVLNWIRMWGEAVVAPPLRLTLPDADDAPFLETAVAGKADALITGNPRHFKPRRGRRAVVIVGPADYLKGFSA